MHRKPVVVLIVVMLLATGLVASVAQAETGPLITFETPTYEVGDIHNQDGWKKTRAAFDHVVAEQSTYPTFGDQSFRISNAVASGSFGDQTFARPLVNEAGETEAINAGMTGGERQARFEAQWDFASVTGQYQEGLLVTVSPDRGDGSRASWIGLSDTPGGLKVEFSDVQSDTPGVPANFVTTTVASDLSRNVPHTVRIVVEFFDGPSNDVVEVWIDGAHVHTGTSWENYYRFDPESIAERNVRTVATLIFRTSVPAANTQGAGFYIDNLQMESGPIIPPTASELLDQLIDDTAEQVSNPVLSQFLQMPLKLAAFAMERGQTQIANLMLLKYTFMVRLYSVFHLIPMDSANSLIEQAQEIIRMNMHQPPQQPL